MVDAEYPEYWPAAISEIQGRLLSNEDQLIISGLIALRTLLKVYEFEIDEDRKPLK